MTAPEPQIVLGHCKLTRIIDGDTVELEVTRRIRVRLADCWAPETHHTRHPSEKEFGLKARDILRNMIPDDAECVLRVRTDGDIDAGDGLTFGRVVGEVFLQINGETLHHSINESMIAVGAAFRTKEELEACLTELDKINEGPI